MFMLIGHLNQSKCGRHTLYLKVGTQTENDLTLPYPMIFYLLRRRRWILIVVTQFGWKEAAIFVSTQARVRDAESGGVVPNGCIIKMIFFTT